MNMRVFPICTAALAVILLAAASKADSAFVQAALRGNTTEIQHAQLQANSADSCVRQYAGRINSDHQIANQQLVSIANSEGIDTSAATPQPTPATGRPAATATQYFRSEVSLHQQALKLYQKEASSGSDPRIRAYAKQQLPVLKKHLQMAQACLKREEQQHH